MSGRGIRVDIRQFRRQAQKATVGARAGLLGIVIAASLAACGGGGGEGSATATNIGPPASSTASSTLAIAGFSPASGAAGSTVTITGTGFTGLESARLGPIGAAFTVISDTQLQLIVPPTAQTGRIELTAPGRTVLSATDFSVALVAQLLSVAPTSVLPGARVTLNGIRLDLVTQVRVNSTTLPIVTQSAGLITVDVPAGTTTGALTLLDALGTARVQSQQLTVVAPMTLTAFAPTSIVTGQTLTLNGTSLDRATQVLFAGGASSPVATRTGTTRITVTVPDAAGSGALRVRGNAGDEILSASTLTVIPAIRVDANAVYRVATVGANVTVVGSGLTEVSGVTVRGVAAAVVSRAATQLVFTVPAGVGCGAIALQSTSQPTVAGGSVVVGNGCATTLAGVEFGQVLGQPATDARQRLVPGKETWVRAYVLSDQTGLVAPTVRLTGYSGVTILGTLPMTGPPTLPTAAGGVVPDSVRYFETQSFNVELPAAWVAAGLSVRVEVDPEQRLGPMTTLDATPSVGTPTRLDIVLVPLVSGGFSPTVPSTAAVLDELMRRFPIARSRITVSARAPYTLTSVADGLDTQTEWQNALSELETLRRSENSTTPNRYYFGFVKRSGGGIAGIGYVPGKAALGWDSATGWMRTMSHELGHNFGRPHAPCGGVLDPDPNFPYAGGILGPQPLLDSLPLPLDVISPISQTDIMGYCNGAWFSDYNYRLIQTNLEAQPQGALAVVQSDVPASDLLLISGTIGVDGVGFRPVHAMRGTPPLAAGDYTLRVVTKDGRTIDVPFETNLVDHAAPPERHFTVAVANPGALDRLEVRHGDSVVPQTRSSRAAIQSARSPATEPTTVDWSERGGQLSIRWNPAAAPYVSVTHVLNGERTVLALHRHGGTVDLDTSALPAGGTLEFGLSDGLNANVVTVPR